MVIGQLQKKTIVLCWSISIITFGADSNALLTYPMASVRVTSTPLKSSWPLRPFRFLHIVYRLAVFWPLSLSHY